MTDTVKLVVKRGYHQQKDDSGIVHLVFVIDGMGKIVRPNPLEFPSGTIWISKGYDDVEQRFKNDELFVIDIFDKVTNNVESQEAVPATDRSGHWALGKSAQKLEAGKLVPVIKSDLPDIGSGLLAYSGTLPGEQFFIMNGGYVYGPFIASQAEDEIVATPNQCLPLSLPHHHIAKISTKDLVEHEIYISPDGQLGSSPNGYITSVKDVAACLKESIDKLDYINNSQLIAFFSRNGFGASSVKSGRKQAEQLKNAISQETKRKYKLADNERLERLELILDDYLKEPEFGWPVIDSWLGTSNGRAFLEALIVNNPGIASSHTENLNYEKNKLEEDISKLQADKRRLELDLSGIKSEVEKARAKAQSEVDEIHKQTAQQLQEQRQKLMADLEENIKNKEAHLYGVERKIEEIQEALKKNIKVQDLESEISYLSRRESELKQVVKEQEKLLKSPDVANELVKFDTILGLLQGRDFGNKQVVASYRPSSISSDKPKDGASVVQAVVDEFDDGGRSFTFEEMASLLITIQQSFMTVLKGLPGAGKTSTAIRLAQAHRIADSHGSGDNFLNVPVSRGWVSGRDFIGFYNALKGSYQPAKTGMYQFLRHGKEKGASETLRLVLLDEANLSPIEHYMSDFLGLFDVEGRGRPIDTGMGDPEQRYIAIPSNLRFIATINNDSTTEPLSPRLCDRVPIISMDLHDSQSIKNASPFKLDGAIGYDDLEKHFGVRKELYDDLPTKVQMIVDLFVDRNKEHGKVITISKRKIIAMQSFYIVARDYMDDTLATDFAVSQYMLPLINGFGKNYRNRIDKIKDQAQRSNLGRTEKLLDDILVSGDSHMGNYSFF